MSPASPDQGPACAPDGRTVASVHGSSWASPDLSSETTPLQYQQHSSSSLSSPPPPPAAPPATLDTSLSPRPDDENALSPERQPLISSLAVKGAHADAAGSGTTLLAGPSPEISSGTSQTSDYGVWDRTPVITPLRASSSWLPPFLRWYALVGFVAAFLALGGALVALFIVSRRNTGLASANDSRHYLWTYGPTAAFAVVATLWMKVEHYSKLLAPWKTMSKGPEFAERSLLLDYVSQARLMTLYASAKNRHFDVFVPVLGTLLLQLSIVFSTGLLALEQKSLVYDSANFPLTSRIPDALGIPNSLSTEGKWFANAFAIKQYQLQPPFGTTDSYAYQTFRNASYYNGTMAATVDAIWTDLDCKQADASLDDRPKPSNVDVTTIAYEAKTPDVTCSGTFDAEKNATYYGVFQLCDPPKGSNAKSLLFLTAHATFGNQTKPITSKSTLASRDILDQRIASVICTPKAEIRKATVTVFSASNEVQLSPGGTVRRLDDKLVSDLSFALQVSLENAMMYLSWPNATSRTSLAKSPLFQLMNATTPRGSLDDLVNNDFLTQSSVQMYRLVSAQLASHYLFTETGGTISGTLHTTENRLIVRPLSLGFLIGILFLMMFAVAVVWFYQPAGVLPKDPTSIAAQASIFAQSLGVIQAVRNTGHSASETELRLLESGPYQTGVSQRNGKRDFSITVPTSITSGSGALLSSMPIGGVTWWRPLGITLLGRTMTIVAPVLIIVALELLYQLSQRSNGLVDVSPNEYSGYSWVYIPALVVWGVNALFDQVDTLARIFQPYHTLTKGPSLARDSVGVNVLGKTSATTLWYSLRRGQYGVFAAALAALLGLGLPITISGLFTAQDVHRYTPFSVHQMDQFNSTLGFYARDGNPDTMLTPSPNFVLHSNMSYPRWTWEEFAMAQFSMSETPANASQTALNVLVPAVRSVTNCVIVPRTAIKYNYQLKVSNTTSSVNFEFSNPSGCNGVGNYRWEMQLDPLNTKSWDLYFGFRAGLGRGVSKPTTGLNMSYTNASYHGDTQLPVECPLAMLVLGRSTYVRTKAEMDASTIGSDPIKDVTMLLCRPYAESLLLNTTFLLPSLNVDPANPPFPQPNTAAYFSEAEILSDDWNALTGVNSYIQKPFPQNATLDPITQAAIWGKGGVTAAQMLADPNVYLDRMNKVYGLIMAQLYNGKARIAAASTNNNNNPPSQPVLTANVVSPCTRLFPSAISTRILDGLLAVMILCAVITFLLIRTKRVLTQNPCTIGAVASLLAGSKLLVEEVMPHGSGLRGDDELRRRTRIESHLYSMGWWGKGEDRRYGINIGVADRTP